MDLRERLKKASGVIPDAVNRGSVQTTIRWKERAINALRVANNPKSSERELQQALSDNVDQLELMGRQKVLWETKQQELVEEVKQKKAELAQKQIDFTQLESLLHQTKKSLLRLEDELSLFVAVTN
jgi:hypothetical protein